MRLPSFVVPFCTGMHLMPRFLSLYAFFVFLKYIYIYSIIQKGVLCRWGVQMDSFIAGAAAGLVVDLTLYPIDTLKTRMQSRDGFRRAGGFAGVYRGLSAVVIGSIPSGAAFFVGYDVTKKFLVGKGGKKSTDGVVGPEKGWVFFSQITAAIVGETIASCVRVPIEMVKQQLQAGRHERLGSAIACITHGISPTAIKGELPARVKVSGVPNLFSGLPIMLLRELPFSVIQMSCYETLKSVLNTDNRPQFLPVCGAISGATAAFLTTPLDVLKTRIMLGQVGATSGEGCAQRLAVVKLAFRELLHEVPRATDRWGPLQRFFRGVVPRVMWISIGGSVFFTTYEIVHDYCRRHSAPQ
uniref:Putative mitochondrial carrier protein n=1 Tax=Trypanosoma congolense (strain IL3000) TaxID=1068625 RepID=G0UYG8_TRYCI|nr:putative mitochondrial carrier protein [Trypanosoma congolense IL3000]